MEKTTRTIKNNKNNEKTTRLRTIKNNKNKNNEKTTRTMKKQQEQ